MTEVERDYHNNRAGRKRCLKIELQLLPFILLKKWCLLRLETCREIMRDWLPEAARRNCSMKLVFSKISQILVKHMCQVLFFIKVAGLQSGVFLWILQIFSEHLLHRTALDDHFCTALEKQSVNLCIQCKYRKIRTKINPCIWTIFTQWTGCWCSSEYMLWKNPQSAQENAFAAVPF